MAGADVRGLPSARAWGAACSSIRLVIMSGMPRQPRTPPLPALSAEVADADLGDTRLTERLGLLVESLADRPGGSFPKAFDDAELELGWRAREQAEM